MTVGNQSDQIWQKFRNLAEKSIINLGIVKTKCFLSNIR
jgi:hypothetical protein